jgi:hypothetical protein
MKFLLSDLQRARFPNPIEVGREVYFPDGVSGTVTDHDGLFFHVGDSPCVNLEMWILHNEKLVPCAQIEIALEPGAHRTDMTDDVIERFHANDDWSAAGLKAALMPAQTLPSRLDPPPGSEVFVNYFKRHEPHVHEMRQKQPDLIWRAYYGGAIPSGFEGFDKDYEDTLLTKMVSYHEPVDPSRQDELLTHLRAQIVKPSDPFMWMADYARRKGFNDVQSLEDGSQVQSGILSLPPTSGPIAPKYDPHTMSLLMANPRRQITALVLFALTEGQSAVWPKPPGFDLWLRSTVVAR